MKTNLKPYLNIHFLICAAVLLVSASGKTLFDNLMHVITRKEPIYLKTPLNQIDEASISPYKIIQTYEIDSDIVEELGTEEYLNCLLEDTTVPEASPVRYCNLFITYYTGDPDTVPHVPDECYVGSGSKQIAKQIIEVEIPNPENKPKLSIENESNSSNLNLQISRIVFEKTNTGILGVTSKFSRLYFFKVNGDYTTGRNDTRAAMAKNIFGKYSYFSKVEWEFYGSQTRPEEKDIIEASEKMLRVVLPVLNKNHWPDWKASEAKRS